MKLKRIIHHPCNGHNCSVKKQEKGQAKARPFSNRFLNPEKLFGIKNLSKTLRDGFSVIMVILESLTHSPNSSFAWALFQVSFNLSIPV